jgi:hypothetical protein
VRETARTKEVHSGYCGEQALTEAEALPAPRD